MNKFSNVIDKEEEKSLQKHIPYKNIEESKIQPPQKFVSTQKFAEDKSVSTILKTASNRIDESFGSNPNISFINNAGLINNIPQNDIKNKVPDLVQSNIKISTINTQSPSEFQNMTKNVNINTKQLDPKISNQMIPILNAIPKEQVNKSEAKPEQLSKDSQNLSINYVQQSQIQLPQKIDQHQVLEKKIEQQTPEKKISQEIPQETIQHMSQEQILKEQLSSSHISQKQQKNVQETKDFEIKPNHEDEIIQTKSSKVIISSNEFQQKNGVQSDPFIINNNQKDQKNVLLKFNLEKGENADLMSKTDFQIPPNSLKLNMSQILESVENTNSTENPQFENISEAERTKKMETNIDAFQTSDKQDFGNYFNDDTTKNGINDNFQEYNKNPTSKFDQNVPKNHSFPPKLSENQINDINSINSHLITLQPTNNHQISLNTLNNRVIGLNTSIITKSPKSSNINKSSSPKFQKSSQVIPHQSNEDRAKTDSSNISMKDPQHQDKNSNLIDKNDNVKISNNLNENQNYYPMIGSKPGLADYQMQPNISDNENGRSDKSNKDLSAINISHFISSKNQKNLVSLENHSSFIIDDNNSNQNAIAYSFDSKINSDEHILTIPSKLQNKIPFDKFSVDDNKIEIDKKQIGQKLQKEIISSQTQPNKLGISSINTNLIYTNKILHLDPYIRENSGFIKNDSELKPDVPLKDEKITDNSPKFDKENQNMKPENSKNLEFDQIITKDHQNQKFPISIDSNIIINSEKTKIISVNELKPFKETEKVKETDFNPILQNTPIDKNSFDSELQNQKFELKDLHTTKAPHASNTSETSNFIENMVSKTESIRETLKINLSNISQEPLIPKNNDKVTSLIVSNSSKNIQNKILNHVETKNNNNDNTDFMIKNRLDIESKTNLDHIDNYSKSFVTPIKISDILDIDITTSKLIDQSILDISFQLYQFKPEIIDKSQENSSSLKKKYLPIRTQQLYQQKTRESSLSPPPQFPSSFKLPQSAIKLKENQKLSSLRTYKEFPNYIQNITEVITFQPNIALSSGLKISNSIIPIWTQNFEKRSLVCKLKEILMKEIVAMIKKNNSQDLADILEKIRNFEQLDGYILKNFYSQPPNMRRCWVYMLGMILNVLLKNYLSCSDVIKNIEEVEYLSTSISLYYYIRQKIFIGHRLIRSASILYKTIKGDHITVNADAINLPLNDSFISLTDKSRIVKKILYKFNMENLDLVKIMKYFQIIFYEKTFPIQEGSISAYLLCLLLQEITINIPNKKFYFHTISHIFYMDMQLNFGGGIRTITDLQQFISSFMHKNVSLSRAQFKINNSDLKYQDVNLSTLLVYLYDFLNIHENFLEFLKKCTDPIMDRMKKLESLLVIILILKNKNTLLSNSASFKLRNNEKFPSQNEPRVIDHLIGKINNTLTSSWNNLLKDIDELDSLKLKNENYHCDFISGEILINLMSGTFFHQNFYESCLNSLKHKLKLIINKINHYSRDNQINLWKNLHDHFIMALGQEENSLWNYTIDIVNCNNNDHCNPNQYIDSNFNMKNIPHLPSFNYLHKIIAIIIYTTKEDDLENLIYNMKNGYSNKLDIKDKTLNKIFYFLCYIVIKIKLAKLEFILYRDQNKKCAMCILNYIVLFCELLKYKKMEKTGFIIQIIFQYLESLLNIIENNSTIEIDYSYLNEIWDNIEVNKMIIDKNQNLKQTHERIRKKIIKLKLFQSKVVMTEDKLLSKHNAIFDKFMNKFVQKIYQLKKKSSPSNNF